MTNDEYSKMSKIKLNFKGKSGKMLKSRVFWPFTGKMTKNLAKSGES